jgi:hypothetical protein
MAAVHVVSHRHTQAANAAENQALQKSGTFARRALVPILTIAVGIIEQLCLISFKLLPRDISRMHVGQEHRPLFTLQATVTKLSTNAHLALTGLAEDESSCVARVVQNAQHPAVLQGAEHQFSGARTLVNSSRPQNAFRLEVMNDTHGGTGPAKSLEQQTHGSLYLLVRVKNHPPTVVIDETQRRFHPQIAAPRLVELTANESGTQQVQFGFTHRPFQS